MKGIYDRLSSIDYDIIGLSYYPEWHNNISILLSTIKNCKTYYPTKQVMVVETGYSNNWYPKDAVFDYTSTYPASAAGQKKFLDALVNQIKNQENLIGLLYWFPEENPYNNQVYNPWFNHGLFNPNNGQVTDGLFSLKAFAPTAGINDIEMSKGEDQKVYDLQGRRVSSPKHGLYIINGKKVVK
jgi:arabinogalactan endo-1,4-beta-galactosidase